MASIDRRVVEMKFDNAAFEKGVSATLQTLDALKGKLNFGNAGAGLGKISAAAKNVNLNPLSSGVDAISTKFTALQVAAVASLSTIVSKATLAGSQLIKSFTVAPISQGFSEYELKLKSTQTILANTARHGTDLATVNRELEALNEYSDKTIYNFAEMTKNASLFTASGMKIEEATTVIKGFSNAAAASGTGAEDAARAAYQLSQALNKGKITMEDWRSLSNAGMGNKNMQQSLIETAKVLGTFAGKGVDAKEATANFTGTLEKGWLTADVMSTYLKSMSGDMTDAEYAAKGFSKAQIAAFEAQAQTGLEAATKVRTLSALMNTLKESVASGWAQSFEIVFGTFTEATDLFTKVNDVVGGLLNRSSDARNKILADWKLMGGRKALLDSLGNTFKAFVAVVKPIREAFSEVFPAKTGNQLAELTDKLREFTKGLMIGEDTAANIKSTFGGFFAVLKIGTMILGGFVKAFFAIFSTVGEAGGGIFAFTAGIGELLLNVQRFLSYTGLIDKFFTLFLSPLLIIKPLIGLVSDLAVAISALFRGDVSGFTSAFTGAFSAFGDSFTGIKDKISGFFTDIGSTLANAANFFTFFSNKAKIGGDSVVANLAGAAAAVVGFFSRLSTDAKGAITDLVSTVTGGFINVGSVLGTFADEAKTKGNAVIGTLATMGSNVATFLGSLGQGSLSKISGLIDTVVGAFGRLKEALNLGDATTGLDANLGATEVKMSGFSAFIEGVKSAFAGLAAVFGPVFTTVGTIIRELALFIGDFVVKLREYLKTFDMQDLVAILNTGAFIAMYIALRGFLNQMAGLIDNISGTFGTLTETLKSMQAAIRANTIMQIAVAVGILIAALFVLALIDAAALKTALVALAVVFAQVAAMLFIMNKIDPKSMLGSAAGMIAIATAILILSGAVKILGEMDTGTLIKGGIALAVMMAAIAGFTKLVTLAPGMIALAFGLNVLAGALLLLSGVLIIYSKIPFSVLAQGVGAMAGTLLLLGLALRSFPKGMPAIAFGLVLLSGAMVVFSGVIAALGVLPMEVVAQGIIVMAAGLAILSIAANSMIQALPGAYAILVIAAALAILAPVLATLGQLSVSTIVTGLLAIAGLLAVLAIGGIAAPLIMALAAALVVLGQAMLLGGAGFLLFSTGLSLLVAIGAAGFAILAAGIVVLLNLLPLMAQQVGHAIIAFAKVIGDAAPKVLEAFTKIILSLLKQADIIIPKLIDTAGRAIVAFAQEIAKRTPQIALAGLNMIVGLLTAIKSKIGQITNLVIDIFTIFLTTIKNRLPQLIQSGVDFILSFIEGLSKAIRGEKKRVGEAGSDLAMSIIEGMVSGLKSIGGKIGTEIAKIMNAMITKAKSILGINSPSKIFSGFGGDVIMGMINGLAGAASGLFGKIRDVIGGLITSAKLNIGNMASVGTAIIDGVISGITGGIKRLANTAANMAKGALDAAKNILGIASPSKEFQKVGKFINEGLAEGLVGSKDTVMAAMDQTSELLKNAITSATADVDTAKEKLKGLTEARDEDQRALGLQAGRYVAARNELNRLSNAKEKNNNAINAAKAALGREGEALRRLTKERDDSQRALNEGTKSLADATNERNRASAAFETFSVKLAQERVRLRMLAEDYDEVGESLKAANSKLEDAIKTRDDYNKSIKDQYSNLPDIGKDTTLPDYLKNLETQIAGTLKLTTSLEQLRGMGLNDAMYKELLSKGRDALPFVQQLLAGGAGAIAQVNALGSQLTSSAGTLGNAASSSLFQAGVDSAQGIVDGLKSQMAAIEGQMNVIAAAMVAAIKKQLQIKSPSRVFLGIAGFATQGLINGLKNSKKAVESASAGLGSSAVGSLKKSLSDLATTMDGGIGTDPVIKPVLDLSDIRSGSAKMGAMLNSSGLSVNAAYSAARMASAGYASNQAGILDAEMYANQGAGSVTLNQYNTSPKALAPAEIYRQTNNQLSVAKEVLRKT